MTRAGDPGPDGPPNGARRTYPVDGARLYRVADLAAGAARRRPWREGGPGSTVAAAAVADTIALLEAPGPVFDGWSRGPDW